MHDAPQLQPCRLRLEPLASTDAALRALYAEAERSGFQGGLDWLELLAAACAPVGTPVHAVLSCGDAAHAVMALVLGPGRTVQPLANFYTSLYLPACGRLLADASPTAASARLATLFEDLARTARPRPGTLTLAPLDAEAPSYSVLRDALVRAGWRVFDYACFGNWHLPRADVGASFDDYLARRPGEVRSTLKRMTRRFEAAGGHIELVGPGDDIARATAAYQTVYASSWKRPEPYPHFVPGLIDLAARRGWLRLGLAWLEGRPVAAQLWIVADGRASIFKLAYDQGAARYSPGSLLTARLMRHVLDVDGVDEVDYLTGDDAYKRAWMTRRRERRGLVAYDPRTPSGLVGLARQHAARLTRPLRQRWRSRGPAPSSPSAFTSPR